MSVLDAPRELKHERGAWFLFSNASMSTHWTKEGYQQLACDFRASKLLQLIELVTVWLRWAKQFYIYVCATASVVEDRQVRVEIEETALIELKLAKSTW